MHEIGVDIRKNRLYITLGEDVKDESPDGLIYELTTEVNRLKSGFSCVVDLRDYTGVEEEDIKYIEMMKDLLLGVGIRKTVRIISEENNEALEQFRSKDQEHTFSEKTQLIDVTDPEEADRLLDEWDAQYEAAV